MFNINYFTRLSLQISAMFGFVSKLRKMLGYNLSRFFSGVICQKTLPNTYILFTFLLNVIESKCVTVQSWCIILEWASLELGQIPSITDGEHRSENFVEIIPVFSTFLNFFKKTKKQKL